MRHACNNVSVHLAGKEKVPTRGIPNCPRRIALVMGCSGKGTDHSLGTMKTKRSKEESIRSESKGREHDFLLCSPLRQTLLLLVLLSKYRYSCCISCCISYFFSFCVISRCTHAARLNYFLTIVVFVPVNDEYGTEE